MASPVALETVDQDVVGCVEEEDLRVLVHLLEFHLDREQRIGLDADLIGRR